MDPNVHSSIIYNCQGVKQPKCPSTNEWIKKYMVCIYTMEYYSSIKSNEMLPFSSMWMELDNIILSEKCHTEKDKYYACFHLYVESKKIKHMKAYSKTESDSQRTNYALIYYICSFLSYLLHSV